MHPGQPLAGLAQKKEEIRARIRVHRAGSATVARRLMTPLHWIDLGVRLRRLFRREAA